MLISTKEIGVTEIPQPAHSTWQYGKKTDYFTTEQLIAFGQACANAAYLAATKEAIPVRRELAAYKEREKTMGWSQE
jgi:hypothetical protein